MTKPPAGSRAPRCRFDSQPCRRPCPHSAASTTRSRVCRGLTFSQPAPRRPASYGCCRSFTTTPSWPRARASAAKPPAANTSAVTSRGARHSSGTTASSTSSRSTSGRPSTSTPSACRTSKKYGVSGDAAGAGRRAGGGHLERLRPAVVAQRDGLAVEHDAAAGEPARDVDELRHPLGDVVERAGEDAHVVAVAVHLHADAVELPLDRRRGDPGERVGDVDRGGGEHRRERPADLSRNAARPSRPEPSAATATSASEPARVTAERTVATGTPAATATASVTTPACAPWRSSPPSSPSSSRCSSAVAAANRSATSDGARERSPCRTAPRSAPPPGARPAPTAPAQRRGRAGRAARRSRCRYAAAGARRTGTPRRPPARPAPPRAGAPR